LSSTNSTLIRFMMSAEIAYATVLELGDAGERGMAPMLGLRGLNTSDSEKGASRT